MKISVQLFVTSRKAIMIESGSHQTADECMEEIVPALLNLKLQDVKKDLVDQFGDD